MESRKEEKHNDPSIKMKSAHEGLSADAKAGDGSGTQKGNDASLGLPPILTQQEIDNFARIQAEAARQADDEASTESTPVSEPQEPPVTAQEPAPVGVDADTEVSPESAPAACEVMYKKNDKGGFDLWIGEGCSREDLKSISKGKARVDNVDLECFTRWQEKYGEAESGAENDQGEDSSLSGAQEDEASLTKMTITTTEKRQEQYDVPPTPPEEGEPGKAKPKKKKKPQLGQL